MILFKRFTGPLFAAEGAGGTNNPDPAEKPGTEPGNSQKQADEGTNPPAEGAEGEKPAALDEEAVQKMIQSATDRIRTDYSKKLKQLEEEKEALIKEKMSEAEKKDYELNKREKAIREAEAQLLASNIETTAATELARLDIPFDFKDFIKGESVDDTKARAEQFHELWKAAVSEEVQKRFAANGRHVQRGQQQPGGGSSSINDLIRKAARR